MDLLDNLISGDNREEEINENYKKSLNENLADIKSKSHLKSTDCKSTKRVV